MSESKQDRGVSARGVVIPRSQLADILSLQMDTIARLDLDGLFDNCKATPEEIKEAGISLYNKNCYWSKDAIEAYHVHSPVEPTFGEGLTPKQRKEIAEATLAEVKAARAIGEVAPLEEYMRITGSSLVIFREELLSLPHKVIKMLIAAEDEKDMLHILEREVTTTLSRLSSRFSNIETEILGADDEDTDD